MLQIRPVVIAPLFALVLAACEQSATPLTPAEAVFAREDATLNQRLAEVRGATARYHNLDAALRDGYVSTQECVSAPGLGGMGVHYINPPLLADASYDPLRPEVLVYEPGPNGRMKLVAVEYLIFRTPWEAAGNTGRPMFLDHPFDQSFGPAAHGLPDHYELHLWIWRPNPNGVFTPFNPAVSCPEGAGH